MNFETIKNNFDKGLWTAQMVKKAVKKGIITTAQYLEITGEDESPTDELTTQEALNIILGIDV